MFPSEVSGFAHVAVESPAVLTGGTEVWRGVLSDLLRGLSDGRVGEVLETCCSLIGGSRGEVLVNVAADPQLAIDLGVASLSLCDVPRCFAGAGLDKIGRMPAEDLEVHRPAGWFDPTDHALEVGVVAMAERHSCAPHDVMAWPFEEVLLVSETAAFTADPESIERMTASARDFPLELLGSLGIGYEKVP